MPEYLGRTIKMFLVEGNSSGIVTADIMNWTGKVIVTPRSLLSNLSSRDDAKRTGVYFLVGNDVEDPDMERVYVGESDNVFERLVQHEKKQEKEFWTRTVFVISKDENLTKAHTLFLESRLIQLVVDAGRAAIDNGTRPQKALPESDTSDMEYFLSQVQMMLPVLGFTFLQQKPKPNVSPAGAPAVGDDASPEFELRTDNAVATAKEVDGEFIVLSGSTARSVEAASLSEGYRRRRANLISRGVLVLKDNYYEFTENETFDSPSGAACAVAGMNANGRTYWKVKATGQTYADWHAARLPTLEEAATADSPIAYENNSATAVGAVEEHPTP